jgi:hypothetical protein
MPDKNGYSVLKEYNNEFACIYSKLFTRYGKIVNYASRLFAEKFKEPLQKISDKIDRNEDIRSDLNCLSVLIEEKFGKTPTLQMPERKYSYYDDVTLIINGDRNHKRKERKYDRTAFQAVTRGNFNRIDRELGYKFECNFCVQDACIHYLTMVYDLWAKLQDEIRFYRSAGNRSFGEFFSSMIFGFFSSIGRSFNTYDETADAYERFCSIYLLPDYDLLFGSNGMCARFNKALKMTKELIVEYTNKGYLIGKNNNTIVFEINGFSKKIILGKIYLEKYKEFEDVFNENNLGIRVNFCTTRDKIEYQIPPNSNNFIFKSYTPFTFKKESTLLTLLGVEAMDTKSWEVNGKHIIFSRRSVANESQLNILRTIQLSRDSKNFKDAIINIGALLKNYNKKN